MLVFNFIFKYPFLATEAYFYDYVLNLKHLVKVKDCDNGEILEKVKELCFSLWYKNIPKLGMLMIND